MKSSNVIKLCNPLSTAISLVDSALGGRWVSKNNSKQKKTEIKLTDAHNHKLETLIINFKQECKYH